MSDSKNPLQVEMRKSEETEDRGSERLRAQGGTVHTTNSCQSCVVFTVLINTSKSTIETAQSSPYVPYIVVGMLIFLIMAYMLDEYSGSLEVHSPGATCNKNWFNITNAVIMVILAALTTYVNATLGHAIGENLLRKYKVGADLDVKDSVKTMLESTGLVNALIFASAVAMCTNGAPTDGCGYLDQMYYNFSFNALGASFYGIICAVAPLMYLPVLSGDEFLEYIQDKNNLRGLGASVVTTVMSGIETVTACVLYGWAVYGRTMGVSLWVGVAFLFIGTVNKFHYQSIWRSSKDKK